MDDDRCVMKIEVNRGLGRVFLHLVLKKWDTAILRSLNDGFAVLTGTLHALGVKKVCSLIPEGDDKMVRFQRLFGFTEAKRINGQILFEREC